MLISTPRSNLILRCLSVFMLFFSFAANAATGTDQTGKQKVTVVAKDLALGKVFKQIEKQTGLRFMYANEIIDVNEKVSVEFEKVALDEVLEELVGKKGVEWVYRDEMVTLKRRESVGNADVELLTISGKVLDVDGTPIPGATVIVKGTKHGTMTNGEGRFTLSGVEANAILVISHVRFGKKEALANSRVVNVSMDEKIDELNGPVIVGYQITSRRFYTGNVTSVKAEDIAKQPITDPLLALQGRVPGMTITQTTGVQGGPVRIQIRGQNSIAKGTQPLIIVDGIPYPGNISGLSSFGSMGGEISALNFINPADVESIDVLKDADATAIYGSRGANGVVLITTKKGKSGSAKLDINVSHGISRVSKMRELMDTKQYLQMRHEAFMNDKESPNIQNAPDLLIWDTTRYTDWQKMFIGGSANYTDAQMSVTGGNDIIQYLVGGNYHRETTVFPGDFSATNGGSHFSITGRSPNQKFSVGLTGSYSARKNNLPTANYGSFLDLPPNAPTLYDSNGNLNWENSTWSNPLAEILVSGITETNTKNLVSRLDMNYRVWRSISLKVSVGYNDININTFEGRPIAGYDPANQSWARASATYANTKKSSWILEPQVSISEKLGPGQLNGLIGGTLLGDNLSSLRTDASDITDDALIRNPASANFFYSYGTGSKYKYLSVFGRIGYELFSKYLLNLTTRRDGSSRFGPRERYNTFYAIGAGWIFSEESFFKEKLSFLSYGKLRASYGTTGNDQIGDYEYLDRYEYVQQSYQGMKGLRVIGMFNPDYKWELTRKAELGIETSFLKDRVSLSISYYRNRSTDQLIGYPQPSMVGVDFITGNLPAVLENKGVEASFVTKNIRNENFEWSTAFNFSRSRNKLVSYEGNGGLFALEGGSLSEVLVFNVMGVNPATGDYLFKGIDGKAVEFSQAVPNNKIDIAPNFFGGIQNTVRIGNFNIDFLFQYVKQNGLNSLYNVMWTPGTIRNQPLDALKRWKNIGDVSERQRFSQNGFITDPYQRVVTTSDMAYIDASFLRCKNLAISWQIPEIVRRKIGVNKGRLYIQCQNLFTISNYPGWDPETQSVYSLPPLRVVTAGIQLSIN
ncbi:SusC/RagA family TonB-linked outer membrane protein [Chitinophaga agri]|uniref:SusC/RagA family TonB-linked outer membrane protein n=1 Tax=Chitinophaga agri TaxID=2703787 RepID=A0A6B9ZFZ7_9BACT|nr:SusC/RagA family TonB-linked outer membrane protein [Chitinophaga agri]QHS61047.1 SusC/RagA family TonB-linked outer membrane protein [Chitinophaga agri]